MLFQKRSQRRLDIDSDSSASEGKNSKQEQTVPNSVPTVLFNYNCPLISLFRAIALSFHSFAPKNGYQLSTDSLTCFPRVGQGVEVGKEHNIGFTRGLMKIFQVTL